ncbi:MAG: Hsp20/alpha crystallin family protein [bacterium]|nr:Hsp20/alpha crystallin family protein [bacterium]
MALVRCGNRRAVTPWSAFTDMEREINRLFSGAIPGSNRPARAWAPAVDIREDKDAYTVEMDLPGMKREDIDISAQEDTLTIKGGRKRETSGDEGSLHRTERASGVFERTFSVPGGFQVDKVSAAYENGVLSVTLPKREESKPKQVEVRVH